MANHDNGGLTDAEKAILKIRLEEYYNGTATRGDIDSAIRGFGFDPVGLRAEIDAEYKDMLTKRISSLEDGSVKGISFAELVERAGFTEEEFEKGLPNMGKQFQGRRFPFLLTSNSILWNRSRQIKNLLNLGHGPNTDVGKLKQLPRTYTVYETPPEYKGKENLVSGIWLTTTERMAPEEWFDLWAKAGWVPWTRNSDPEEDGIVYPFIRFDHYQTTLQTYTFHDPSPKSATE